jgi:hypothetical protein
VTSSGAKACSTADGFVKVLKAIVYQNQREKSKETCPYLDFKNVRGANSLNDQLRNAVSFLNYEILC